MIQLPKRAQEIIDTLKKHGFEAYAVGGCVRNLIMKLPTKGWDFTTIATPENVLKIFPDSFYDNQFGTVGIKIRDKGTRLQRDNDEVQDIYEVTTYRSEGGYSDFRHPDKVSWGTSLETDLSRRDFTINAIAFNGTTIIDPFHGQGDMAQQIIRAVGDPNLRFSEDALRMMRAIRIASQLGFQIDDATIDAVRSNASLISNISAERVRDELFKLVISHFAFDGILMLKNSGLMKYILPEFEETFTVEQKSPKRHHIFDVGMHSVMALKHCPSGDPVVKLATLLHDVGKAKTAKKDESGIITFYNHEVVSTRVGRDIAYRLRFSKKQTELFTILIRWHQFSVDERQTDSAIRRFIRRVGKDNLSDMLALRIGDRLGGGAQETSWRLELFKKRLEEVQKQPFGIPDLKISGYDVMEALGCKPGKIVGETLAKIFSEVENGTLLNEREQLLERIKSLKSP